MEDKLSKRDIFSCFLKISVEGAKWIDSRRLFPREGLQVRNAHVPALVFTLRTGKVIPFCNLNEWDGSDVASIVHI